jgi:uncharacterized protein involved in type VI secretion and phage assembly
MTKLGDDLPIPLLPALLGQRIRDAEDRAGLVHEAVIGLVVDNRDPEKLGRVKLRFPTLPGQDTSGWAPLSAFGAGPDRGWCFLPEVEDEVLVVFEHGDFHRPVVLGALWNGKDAPPERNHGKNERRALVSREGSRVVFDDEKGTITIEDGKGVARIVVSSDNKITIEARSGDISLQAPAGAVSIVAGHCDVQAAGGFNVQAGGTLNMGGDSVAIQGSRVSLNAGRLDLNPGSVASPAEASASPEDVSDPL